LLCSALPAQAPLPGLRLQLAGNGEGLRLVSVAREGRAFVEPRTGERTDFYARCIDADGKTLARVPFALPNPRKSVWIEGGRPLPGDGAELLVVVEIPDHGHALAEVWLEHDTGPQVRRIGTVVRAELERPLLPLGLTQRDVRITGPSSNRFDLVILAEGYLAGDETQFNFDVDELVARMVGLGTTPGTEPFRHYQDYINVRSVFRESPNRMCLSPPQPTAYGVRFVPDNYQSCGRLDLTNFNVTQATADANLAGFDPGGLLVLVHSWAHPQILYGGAAVPGGFAVATTNRVARPAPFTPFLRFPFLPIHELGHSIGRLADETNLAFATCQGCPPPEPPPATDFVEFNTTRFFNQSRWFALSSKLNPNPVAGGGGCDGSCSGVCSLNVVPCLPPGPGQMWNIFHALPSCMMNILDAGFCPPCMEELTLQLHAAASIDPVDNPLPASTALMMTLTDQVTFSWEDQTLGASKSGTWFIDTTQQTVAAPGLSLTRTGAQIGLGRHTIRVDVTDTTRTVASNPSSWLVGFQRIGSLNGSHSWTVDVVAQMPAGPALLTVAGGTGGYNSQLGRYVARIGDWNRDDVPDLGVTTAAGVHAVSGKTGASLYFVPQSTGGATAYVGGLGDIDLNGYPELLRSEDVPAPQQIRAYGFPGVQTAQWIPSNKVRDLVPLGEITGDLAPDFASAATDRVELFSGAGSFITSLPLGGKWLSLAAFENGHIMQNLGYEDFDGFGWPDGDINGDGRADNVVMIEDPHPGLNRWVRLYSNTTNPFQLWERPLDPITHHWLATVGDTDGNLNADFLVATPEWFTSIGRVELRSGTDGTVLRTHVGTGAQQFFGRGVCGVGDVDLDGAPDYAIARKAVGNIDYVDVRSGRTGNLLTSVTANHNGSFGFGQSMASVGDVNDDGIPDLAIGNWSENNALGRLRVYSPAELWLTSPQTQISGATGGTQDFNLDLPDVFGGFTYIIAGSFSGTAIPGVPFQALRLPIVPDGIFTLAASGSPLYTNAVGTLSATGTATASITLPAPIASVLVGLRAHHIALIVDPLSPTVAAEVTNAVWVDFVP
jgi:hypothetical protein